MSLTRIASRYAKSLIDLAVERNELDVVLKDIELFNEIAKNRDFILMLKSPIINASKKKSIFKAIFEGKISKSSQAFFDIIITKSREPFLLDITKEFVNQFKTLNKISTAFVTSAASMSPSELNNIKSKLLESDITMENVEIISKVDPSLIGGFVIEVGDKLYDASAKYKLDKLKKEFIDTQFVKSF